ncbi:multi-sensor signal transduction histidine kinase [Tolypothrix tenuis PCC 7101]|uniref:histidine kinase n=1 Tax=Tolypothrix tenuis PCC 7101 TaxID=231146 RepID=A0A1Z4N081_9CYAN|nr:PAS domain S-box protein [Aulosira sp. FACHB-113]BAY99100.1 multi-sensor signal transduction histidine kinase [Tolypothrix tenuis PCC 7101]BAZ76977.1 multi-sensor signal transduction histidine kinase [Aulosira laxa NIES-50]
MKIHSKLLSYGVAIGSTAIALLLSLWVESLLFQPISAFFYIAVIVSTWYGGSRSGIVTVVLSTLAIDYFLIPPKYQMGMKSLWPDILRVILFLLVALIIHLLTSNFLKSKQKIQKLNQELAQENAHQLRMALSAAQMGMWDWNLVTGEIIWSPEQEQLFGLAIGAFDGRYETFEACLHPEDRPTVDQKIQQALQSHSNYQNEYRILWPDGSIHWVESRGHAFYDAANQPVRITGTVMAIDERKQAQDALQQSEQRYRALVHASAQIVWRTDTEGGTIAVPDNWQEITGQSPEECLGWGWLEVIHPDDRDRTAQAWQASSINRTVYAIESRIRMKNGNYRDFAVRGVPMVDANGNLQEWIGTCTDITERKQAEAALRENQIQLQRQLAEIETIYQSAPIGLSVLDTDLGFVRINQRLAEINGFPVEAHIGRTIRELLPELADAAEQLLLPILATGTPVLNVELTGTTPAQPGVQRTWLESFWPLKDGKRIIGISTVCEEITQRKQTEIALREREASLRLFFQYVPAGIAMFDRDMRYIIASQRWVDDYRLDSIESLIGRSHYEIFPEIPERWRQIHQRCMAGAIERCDEELFVRLDGSQQWIRWEIRPWHNATGEIGGIIIFGDDITQRKQAQIALEQLNTELEQRVAERTAQLTQTNERLLETIIQQQKTQLALLEQAQLLEFQAVITRNMAEGVCLIRATDAIIVYANPKFEQMFGYNSGELNGQHVSIVNYATESVTAEDVNQAIRTAVLSKGEATYEVHNVKKDGTPFWCSATCCVFTHPQYGDVLVAVHQDITDRKAMEEALRQSEEKFRQLADNIQAVFWISDLKVGQVLYVSKGYERIWQRNCQSLYENPLTWLDPIHPDDRPLVEIAFGEQITTGKYDIEYRIIRPDGSIRWIHDRAFPIRNELGEIIRMTGIAEDITEQHKIEQIKSEFISIVSHELRTPLTAIRAALGLLNSGVYDNKPEKFKRMIEIAAIDSDRLVRLVNDILDLERLESGRAVLDKRTYNAADLIQQAVEGVQAIAKQQNITLEVHSTDTKVLAAADAIIQTLTNLLSNAIKFSPADSTITLSVEQQINWVLFKVSDRGRGIPQDKLEVIFGRFQQVDASDSRDKGGTGLGLAICRSIIDQHGGNIWAESTLRIGSTFFFTLPLARD